MINGAGRFGNVSPALFFCPFGFLNLHPAWKLMETLNNPKSISKPESEICRNLLGSPVETCVFCRFSVKIGNL